MVSALAYLSTSEGARLTANVEDMASEPVLFGKANELTTRGFIVDEPLPHVPLIRLTANPFRVTQEALDLIRPGYNLKPEIRFTLKAPDLVGN